MSDTGKIEIKNGYIVTDRRGLKQNQELPNEVCRVCGCEVVHSKQYNQPTMDCITYLRSVISSLVATLKNQQNEIQENDE